MTNPEVVSRMQEDGLNAVNAEKQLHREEKAERKAHELSEEISEKIMELVVTLGNAPAISLTITISFSSSGSITTILLSA